MSDINLQSAEIIINILSKTFFSGDVSIIRPHIIALEAILLFSVVSLLSVISGVQLKRPLPVSKRTPAQ